MVHSEDPEQGGAAAPARISDYLNPATILTLAGLSFGVLAAVAALWGEIELALAALIVAGLCDLFDGRVARSLDLGERARAFGVQIDSMADMVSFGVAPGLIAIAAAGGAWQWVALAAALPYAACAALRLADFNLRGFSESGARGVSYVGLPVTYAALIFPVVYVASRLVCSATTGAFFALALIGCAGLFVSAVPIPKPSGRAYAALSVLAAIVIAALISLRAFSCSLP